MRGSGGTPSMGVCPTARRSRPSKTPGVPPDRGLAQRILIVTPANLMFQWQREMSTSFARTSRLRIAATSRNVLYHSLSDCTRWQGNLPNQRHRDLILIYVTNDATARK